MPSTTISPHARIGALIGVLLTALAGSAIYLLHGHGHSQPATVTPPAVQHQPTTPTTPSTPKPVHVVHPTVNPLLPAPLQTALDHYPLVVAGFYNPHAPVDMLTIEEARAGASAAHVPFVQVNLLDDAVAGPLTALLPSGQILPNPGFAIYTRPGTLVYRSDGYLARTSVAQAVKDAGPPGFQTSQKAGALLYTRNPKAVIATFERQGIHAAGFSDISCRLYGGNQRTGWQHVGCSATYTHSGIAHRLTSVITPQSCSRVIDVVTIDGAVSQVRTHRWPKSPIFTCKEAR